MKLWIIKIDYHDKPIIEEIEIARETNKMIYFKNHNNPSNKSCIYKTEINTVCDNFSCYCICDNLEIGKDIMIKCIEYHIERVEKNLLNKKKILLSLHKINTEILP